MTKNGIEVKAAESKAGETKREVKDAHIVIYMRVGSKEQLNGGGEYGKKK